MRSPERRRRDEKGLASVAAKGHFGTMDTRVGSTGESRSEREGASSAGAGVRAPLAFLTRPKVVVWLAVGVGAAVGWAWLMAMIAGMLANTDMTTLGPGMSVFNRFNGFAELTPEMRAALSVLCGPTGEAWSLGDGLAVAAMWVAMVFAMMLPSAAPVLTSYASLAEEKRRAGELAASPLVLAAGYLAIWIAFAVVATVAQGLLTQLRVLTPAGTTVSEVLAGTTLIAAGLYQFSPLKLGCLTRCRFPAPYFADNWTPRAAGVFRQGIEQGLDCLGCCWALMVVMFAVGVMNVVWIAVIGAVMTIEKVTTSLAVPRLVGLVLLLWGAALIGFSPVGQALLARFHLL
jgi:predicted metal-binding membrane protein